MINHIQMNRMNPSAFASLTGESIGMPETGEFDFLNYLLGLQVNPIENGIEVDGSGIQVENNSGSLVESDKKLLELFSKKKDSENAWLMGQTGPSTFQPNSILPLETKQTSDLMSLSSGKAEPREVKTIQGDNPKVSASTVLLEDPLEKLAFDAAVKQKDGKSVLEDPKNLPKVETRNKKVEGPSLEKEMQGLNTEVSKVEVKTEVKVEKSRKKDTDQLDLAVDDKNLVNNERAMDNQPKQIHNSKVTHNHAPELFQKVETMVHKGGGRMTLSLTPPELGQVEIEVTTKGRNVEVSVKSDNDFAKAAIESQVADLQQSLQEHDLNLSKMEVQVSREMDPSFLENQFGGFSKQGNFYQQSQGFSQDSLYRKSWDLAAEEASPLPVSMMQKSQTGNGRVDIRI